MRQDYTVCLRQRDAFHVGSNSFPRTLGNMRSGYADHTTSFAGYMLTAVLYELSTIVVLHPAAVT